MKRGEAERLIERLRLIAAGTPEDVNGPQLLHMLRTILATHGVEPLTRCNGEAHSNAFIDNCHQCAPRWGWLGERIKVT